MIASLSGSESGCAHDSKSMDDFRDSDPSDQYDNLSGYGFSSRSKVDFFLDSDRKYRAPGVAESYPIGKLSDFKELLVNLGEVDWDFNYNLLLSSHRTRILEYFLPLVFGFTIMSVQFKFIDVPWPWGIGEKLRIAVLADALLSANELNIPFILGILTSVFGVFSVHRNPRLRIFRCLRRAERQANVNPRRVSPHQEIQTLNWSAQAARCLFIRLRGNSSAWGASPAVSDRALMNSHPLIDLRVEDVSSGAERSAESRHIYARFLRDVSYLVILEREDLIPLLRCKYWSLAGTMPNTVDDIPEREAQFLDPLRNHNKFSIVKDYYYPLASWLSFVVAVIALLVSLARS